MDANGQQKQTGPGVAGEIAAVLTLKYRFDESQRATDVAEICDWNQSANKTSAEQIEHDLRLGPFETQFFPVRTICVPGRCVCLPGETCATEKRG